MSNNIIKSIQQQLFKLTKKKFSKIYVKKKILPIIEYIIECKKEKILISGSQGIGKSTLLKILEKNINFFYNKKILCLSLDDFYLTKKQRIFLSKKINPLLLTRGVPGTHDTHLLLKSINKFEKKEYPIKLPIFDKLKDDRSKQFKYIKPDYDILLLEGWCCGCPPILNSYLFKNLNFLEKNEDKNRKWRIYYNKKLKKEYYKIFNRFEILIYLKASSFSHISKWRLRQEKMNKLKNKNEDIMNKKEVINFVQYYEKITKWMIKKIPSTADVLINIDKNQKILKIKKKSIF